MAKPLCMRMQRGFSVSGRSLRAQLDQHGFFRGKVISKLLLRPAAIAARSKEISGTLLR